MAINIDIARLRMAPARVPVGRKPSGDTSTVMVRCHPEQYSELVGRHADCIKRWHEAWQQQQELTQAGTNDTESTIKGENDE